MYEITCFDSDGNSIDHLCQWDINQKVNIRIYGQDEDYLKYEPIVLFSNRNSKEARSVRSTVIDGQIIQAKIPNILLQDALPIFVSVYLTDSEEPTSQKTILSDEIIVRKQPKPSNYEYIENIERITAQIIKEEIKNELIDEVNESGITFTGITLSDLVTEVPYEIFVSDGRLRLEALSRSETAVTGIIFKDRYKEEGQEKDKYYRLYVYNGKLRMQDAY